MKKLKFVIRIYSPGDPFHKRESFFEKRASGETYLQYTLGNWAVMFALVSPMNGDPMPFFMYVNHA